jgi:hypothetical protein
MGYLFWHLVPISIYSQYCQNGEGKSLFLLCMILFGMHAAVFQSIFPKYYIGV